MFVCEEVEIDVLQLIRLSLNFFNEFGKVKISNAFPLPGNRRWREVWISGNL